MSLKPRNRRPIDPLVIGRKLHRMRSKKKLNPYQKNLASRCQDIRAATYFTTGFQGQNIPGSLEEARLAIS